MYEDIPKSNPLKTILIVLLILIAFAVIGYFIFKSLYPKKSSEVVTFPSSLSLSPSPTTSAKFSPSPSLLTSPSPSATPDYKVPTGETYVLAQASDTNGDSKDETLVVTKMQSGKYHVYVLSSDGNSVFDDKTLDRKPVRIATQTYDATKESYLSWMLIFSENSGDLAFVHWNGTKYEIPQGIGI